MIRPTGMPDSGGDRPRPAPDGGHAFVHGDFACSFAVVRTSALPLRALADWVRLNRSAGRCSEDGPDLPTLRRDLEADRALLRRRLALWCTRPEVREALCLASPDLAAKLPRWLEKPGDPALSGVESSLVRYFQRMCGRSTPFGLFAGCALADVGAGTDLSGVPGGGDRRHTQPDPVWLACLADSLTADPRRQAAHGGPSNPVALPVTGLPPLAALTRSLVGLPHAQHAVAVLGELRDFLSAMDRAGAGVHPDHYAHLKTLMEELHPLDPGRPPVQVDLWRTGRATLSEAWIREALRGVRLLHAMHDPGEHDGLRAFTVDFAERFGEDAIPLEEALDPVRGVGLPKVPSTGGRGGAPLLRGLPLRQPAGDRRTEWKPRHALMLQLVHEAVAAGDREIVLGSDDVQGLAAAAPAPLPDAFAVAASLSGPRGAEPRTSPEARLHLRAAVGPSGARLLGRLCTLDGELERRVRRHLETEERRRPDAVFAEVVHLPSARLGAAVRRPVLRGYEIVCGGVSGAPHARQIPVSDLMVSVSGGDIRLWSRRLGREIVPRLSAAHHFAGSGDPVYRFLGLLQGAGVAAVLRWRWGPLQDAPFLPRVRSGAVVLSPATWSLSADEIARVSVQDPAAGFAAVQELRRRRSLPRFVCLEEGDRSLPADLDNALSVEALRRGMRGRGAVRLTENPALPDAGPAPGAAAEHAHDIIIPFVRSRDAAGRPAAGRHASPAVTVPAAAASHPSGSPWLYARIHAAPAVVDDLVGAWLPPVLRRLEHAGVCARWFFVRYRDPAPHLRLRLQGDRDRLSAEAVPALHAVLEPLLASGAVRQWSLDTYRPERRRYGGADGLSAAEAIFAADSAAVARLVALLSDGAPVDTRWLLGLCGVDRLLGGFGFDTAARLAVTAPLQDAFAREFGGGRALRSALGALHRSKRHLVDAALADDDDACAALLAHEDTRLAGLLAAGRRVLDERGDAIADAVCELRRLDETRVLERPLPAVAASLVHMHLNRMLAEQQRAQERVIYELLCRSYTSRLARGRGRVADGDPALESESGAGG